MADNQTVIPAGPAGDAVKRALRSMFPTTDSFLRFRDNDREISRKAIPSILRFAFHESVIAAESEKAFLDFLKKNRCPAGDRSLPPGLTFSDLIETLSEHLSVNALVAQLDHLARTLGMPAVRAPMITRLKKNFLANTPKKRALIRLLAFRLAFKHPDIFWNYELLLQFPQNASGAQGVLAEKAGAAISVHLQGRGDIITPADVAWLKNELAECVDVVRMAGHLHKMSPEIIGASSFAFRCSKDPGPPEEPRLYARAVRILLAVAHQLSVRWLVCPQSNPGKRLLMIIDAGPKPEARPLEVPPGKNALWDDSGILLTEFAHLCAGLANLKGFKPCRPAGPVPGGRPADLWSVVHFWPNHFYDYVPRLLTDDMLPADAAGAVYENFRQALLFPELSSVSSSGALTVMHRCPQNSLLLIEIAKVLRARRMPHEADAVLAQVLLSQPDHPTARFMRFLIYFYAAVDKRDFAASSLAFERALAESRQITGHTETGSEVWAAVGMLHFNRAVRMIRFIRHGNGSGPGSVRQQDVLDQLGEAEQCFYRGLAASPTGQDMNCLLWLLYALSFSEFFCADPALLRGRSQSTLSDHRDIFRRVARRVLENIGWMRPQTDGASGDDNFDTVLKAALLLFARYENAMYGRSYIPGAHCLFGMLLWDFSPSLTPEVCRAVLDLFEKARAAAEKLAADRLCVYTVMAGYIPADVFIARIEKMTGLIRKPATKDARTKGSARPIPPAKARKMSCRKLMLLEADRRDSI
ncbi:MAG: hypothetical protein PHG54_10110 [Smithellaceae bacterium]|nr:hypothetical protein [Smithellaceae bacterium]